MIRLLLAALLVVLALFPAAATEKIIVGYVDILNDPVHRDRTGFGGLVLERRGRAWDGARLAAADLARRDQHPDLEFELVEEQSVDRSSVLAAIERVSKRGAHAILVDAPADVLTSAAKAMPDLLLFNVAEDADALRAEGCAANLWHVAPSASMRTDGLVQFLLARKWRNILVLQGPNTRDAAFVRALERSSKKFGAVIVARRDFVLGSDPRSREQNNVSLLTGGADYDVVFVADESGEFARFLPYQTLRPRPVVGDAGLTPQAWHWAWDRDGGSNLSRRFARLTGRSMRAPDWAAWFSFRAIAEAALHEKPSTPAALTSALKSKTFGLDGSKGQALSFRPWDNQLRQPIQLATSDAVIAQAPLPEFLHQYETLDTLGVDQPESTCRLIQGPRP